MSTAEVFYRCRQYGFKKLEKYNFIHYPTKSILLKWPNPILEIDSLSSHNIDEAFEIFGEEFDYNKSINWHQDIKTKRKFPFTFSKDLNIRHTNNISAKVIWEINRLQFLTKIAFNYRKTGNTKYKDLFRKICESWIDNNPYLIGVNWYSNIEINIRLITWYLSWEILDINAIVKKDNIFKNFIENKFIPTIYSHCVYSFRNFSKYSSANNHLISEYAGLYVASSFWQFKESKKWQLISKNGLESEIHKQHSDQGVNKEEAAEYIQFVTDFFLLSYIIAEKKNEPFSTDFKQKLNQIFNYINNFLDINGNYPRYGDGDDGKAFILSENQSFNNFKSLQITGATLFNDSSMKSKGDIFDLKNKVLLGISGEKKFEKLPHNKKLKSSIFYPAAGHYILRKQTLSSQEIHLHFNAAPLGFLSIAAHGHADCLSFQLNIDGKRILVDSGTYIYHDEFEYRKYFISTLAHNTICIDRTNQAILGGPTLWHRHYNPTLINAKIDIDVDQVEASHNGYVKIGVQHKRKIILDKINDIIQITDFIGVNDNKMHNIALPFHLHPECEIIDKNKNSIYIKRRGSRDIIIDPDKKYDTKIFKGETNPIIGWYSRSFLKKEPSKVIFCSVESCDIIELKSIIRIINK